MQISARTYRWSLFLAFLVAFGLRLGVTQHYQGLSGPLDEGAFPDQLEYEKLAWSLSAGKGYGYVEGKPTALRTPGTSLTLLPVYLIFGRSLAAARIWICLLSALTCLVSAWLAREAFGRLAGIAAAALLVFDPGHFYYAQHLVSEVPYGLFSVLGTVLAYKAFTATRGAVPWALAAGFVLGFAMLVRPQLVLILPFGALVALFVPSDLRARIWKLALLQATCAVAVLVPWVVRNAMVMGSPTMGTISGLLFWGSHNEDVVGHPWTIGSWMPVDDLLGEDWPEDELEQNAVAWQRGFDYLEANPEVLPRLTFHKLRRFFSPYAGTRNRILKLSWAAAWWGVGPLFLFGLFVAWRRDGTLSILLGLHLTVSLAITVLFHGAVRYRHVLNPLIVVYAALCLAVILPALLGRLRPAPRPSEPSSQ